MGYKLPAAFDVQAFLDCAGVARTVATYRKAETIYAQGDACTTVMYLQHGEVMLSVLSKMGREAIVAVIGPAHFFGLRWTRRSSSARSEKSASVPA